jgi:glycopeptide antibiotics resistance protein
MTILLFSAISFFVLFYIRYRSFPDWFLLLAAIYFAWMSTLLLFRPVHSATTGWNIMPFIHSYQLFTQLSLKNLIWYFGGNTLLFIPMGYIFAYLAKSKPIKTAFLCGCSLMIVVEFTQAITRTGVCDIDDLLMNISGIMLGSVMRIGKKETGKNQKVRNTNC